MTKEIRELELIHKLGAIAEYVGELTGDDPIFYSEEMLPDNVEKMKRQFELLLILATGDEERKVLMQASSVLKRFIPHKDAVKLAQCWNKIKTKSEEKDPDKEAKRAYYEIITKYVAQL